ncbi:MAG TPA: terminase large subunit [Stellaceae bacterium]|jgi:hypothetical protein
MSINLCRDLAHALDPVAFAQDRLGFDPDPWQRRMLRSERRKAALNCCRQSGKSTSTSVLALHTAIYDPGSLVLLIAPALRQSRELFGKVLSFRERLEPSEVLEEDNRLSCTFASGSRIVCLPGDPKTVRGFSAPALVIEDEAAQVDDAMTAAVRPMLAVSNGRLILMSTPFGRRGHFYETWENGDDDWERIEITAEQCPRISADFLKTERAEIGETLFQQEYRCQFIDSNTSAFSSALIDGALSDEFRPFV